MLHYPQLTSQSHYVSAQAPLHLEYTFSHTLLPPQTSWSATKQVIVSKWRTKARELRRKRGVVGYLTSAKASAAPTSLRASVHTKTAEPFDPESDAIEKSSGTGATVCPASVLCQSLDTPKIEIELTLKLINYYGFHKEHLSSLEQDLQQLVDSMASKKSASAASKDRHQQSNKDGEIGQTPEQYIATRKQEAVEAVMAVFNKWLEKRLSVISYSYECSDGSEKSHEASNPDRPAGAESGKGHSRGRPKRQLSDDEGQQGSSGGGDGEGNGGDRSGNKRARKAGERKPLFACPFFQHDPGRHCTHRSCTGPGWPSIHRLKEHLTRTHRLPKHTCPRCREPMADAAALERHLRSDVLCPRRDVVRVFGIDDALEKKLKERKKTTSTLTEEQKWKDMYMILFPSANKNALPSPYYDSRDSVTFAKSAAQWKKFEKHIQKELPQAVQKRVEQRFDGVEFQLLNSLSDIIRDEILHIFKGFPQGASAPGTPGPDSRSASPKLANSTLPAEQSKANLLDNVLPENYIFPQMFLSGTLDQDFAFQFDLNAECPSDSGYASNSTMTTSACENFNWT